MVLKYFCSFLTVLVIFSTTFSLDIGDVCQLRGSDIQGVCKLSSDCPSAELLANNGVRPTLCGFPTVANRYIICCENTLNTGQNFPQANENSFLNLNIDNSESSDAFVFPDSDLSRPQIHRSLSEEKCIEYSKSVTGIVSAAPLITDTEQVVSINVELCDYTSVPLIVGGSPAIAGEFPYMAAIGYNDENAISWLCGGTLVSEYYVVTAAHCANTKHFGEPVKIRLGDLDLKSENDNSEYVDYDIIKIKIHENYRPPARYNDIALLRLSPKVQFTKFIRPACLWNKARINTTKMIATGWGKTGIADDQSDKLLKVALNLLDNSVCSRTYPTNSRTLANGIQSTMLCAGDLRGGKDTCQGDSGGPLVVTMKANRCIFHIVGITSFGKGCGGPNPAVYTRVSEYIEWIENIIW